MREPPKKGTLFLYKSPFAHNLDNLYVIWLRLSERDGWGEVYYIAQNKIGKANLKHLYPPPFFQTR